MTILREEEAQLALSSPLSQLFSVLSAFCAHSPMVCVPQSVNFWLIGTGLPDVTIEHAVVNLCFLL